MSRLDIIVSFTIAFTLASVADAGIVRRAEMELPESLGADAATSLKIKRSAWTHAKKPLSFGDAFKIEDYKATWVRGRSSAIGKRHGKTEVTYERDEKHQSYRFTSRSASSGDPWKVTCDVLAGSDGIDIHRKRNEIDIDLAGTKRVECLMERFGTEPWELVVVNELGMEHGDVPSYGWLEGPDEKYSVRATGKLAGMKRAMPGVLGYVFEDEDEGIAAFEAITPGRLILANNMSEERRALFAAATAALLLNQVEGP